MIDAIPGLSFDDNVSIKVRMANTDTKVGKSNGYRIIYYAIKSDCEIYLLTLYYKKEDNRIPTNKEIENLVKRVLQILRHIRRNNLVCLFFTLFCNLLPAASRKYYFCLLEGAYRSVGT